MTSYQFTKYQRGGRKARPFTMRVAISCAWCGMHHTMISCGSDEVNRNQITEYAQAAGWVLDEDRQVWFSSQKCKDDYERFDGIPF